MEKNGLGSRYSLTEAEYIRMRKSEDNSYEYHGADAEEIDEANADDG